MQQLFYFKSVLESFKKAEKHARNISADMLIRFAKSNRQMGDQQIGQAVEATKKEMDTLEEKLNAEVTPGQLYEYYSKVLYRVDDRLKEARELV